ncbi:polysaccharide deacetylase family protein [Pedococcus sp. NPDC057267]|uniref:polysaccharide deacetylase family protein n=1 Tax=Pedococcus sp. NPDC057267 TaxID=3346077 RepID=UPI003626DC96
MATRRTVLAAAGAACLLAAQGRPARSTTGGHTRTPGERRAADPAAVNRVLTDFRMLALTFDDGPDPRSTPQVLDILRDHAVTATFFMIGRNVAQHPQLAERVRREGHTIGNHTADHLWLDAYGSNVVRDQLERGTQALVDAGLPRPRYVRPPRGWTSPGVGRESARQSLRSIFWSDCLEAHLYRGTDQAAEVTARAARPGSIILCHDGGTLDGPNPQHEDRSTTVAALPRLLERLLAANLRPVTLPELLRDGPVA